MKTAYIFHDSFSDQYADWYPWLKVALQGFGYNVIVPSFPTPAGQSLESWTAVMKNYLNSFDEETIFVGHGTGAMFALRLLENSTKQIRGLYCVAGYAERIGHAGYDRVNETFLAGDFKWETIISRAINIRAFAGSDDPFVPATASDRFAKSLNISCDVISGGGHLNRASGFSQFVALASAIREGEGMVAKGMEVTPLSLPTTAEIQTGSALSGSDTSPLQGEDSATVASVTTSPAIHTMYQDMTTLVNSNQGSVASSLLEKARDDEAHEKNTSPASSKNIGYFVGTLIVAMIIVGMFGYVFLKYLPAQKNAAVVKIASIISAESHVQIDIANRPSYAVMQDIRSAFGIPPAPGAIRDIYYTAGAMRASFPSVMAAIESAPLPERLQSELQQPAFMHGLASASAKPAHFLILPVANYDTAFAGLREWEPTMFRDIGIFMNVPDSFLKTKLAKDAFGDEMIANRNLRVLRYAKPNDIDFDEGTPPSLPTTPSSAQQQSADATPPIIGGDSATDPSVATTTTDEPSDISNFISEGVAAIQNNNPFANTASPYDDGDIMVAYFFLTEKTIVITDNVNIIPEILSRFANRQIYQ